MFTVIGRVPSLLSISATTLPFEVEISQQGRSETVKGLSEVVSKAKAQLKALKAPGTNKLIQLAKAYSVVSLCALFGLLCIIP